MENSNDFNNTYCLRTMKFGQSVYKFTDTIKITESSRNLIRQLSRCSSSVAANLRAASRARSRAEYYAKMCIVVEECDECCFWLDFMKDLVVVNETSRSNLLKEAEELLKVFSKTKKKLKENLNQGNHS
jgi:four helix bundle protein